MIWVVSNGYVGNGAVCCILEAPTEALAIEHARFYEDDEPIEQIERAFAVGVKGWTMPTFTVTPVTATCNGAIADASLVLTPWTLWGVGSVGSRTNAPAGLAAAS